jgi:hypothetical protein
MNFEQTFVKPKKINKMNYLTIKHATIDSAQNNANSFNREI